MLQAARDTQLNIPARDLIRALESGDPRALEQLGVFRDYAARLQPPVRAAFTQGISSGAELGLASIGLEASFNRVSPWMIRAIETEVARVLDQVPNIAAIAVRDALRRGFTDGIPPRVLARQIRPLIGLDPKGILALANYRAGLEEQELPDARIQALVDAYALRLQRERALLISRTETLRASNSGLHGAWRQAEAEGFLDPATTRRQFMVTPDDRTCPICLPMDKQQVRLNEAFVTPNQMFVMNPPVHVNCRCSERLVFIGDTP